MHTLLQGPHHRLQEVLVAAPLLPPMRTATRKLAARISTCTKPRRATFYRRSKVNQYENQSLIKIENVNQKEDTEFYMGKKYARPPPRPSLLP